MHYYNNALSLGSDRIGELYEISYGLVLLGKKEDRSFAKELLSKAQKIEPKENLDTLYKKN